MTATSSYLNQPPRDYLTVRAARLATKLAAERAAKERK